MNRHDAVDLLGHISKKIYPSRGKKSFIKEISLLFIVGLFGCFGTLFILKKAWIPASVKTEKKISNITIPEVNASSQYARTYDPSLEIKGDYQTHAKLDFTIVNYNPQATYTVDFGDGELIQTRQAKFTHQYKFNGYYNVRLNMEYKDASTSIYSREISIEKQSKDLLSSL